MNKTFLTLLIGLTFLSCNSQNKEKKVDNSNIIAETDSYSTSKTTDVTSSTPSSDELKEIVFSEMKKTRPSHFKDSDKWRVKILMYTYEISNSREKFVWTYDCVKNSQGKYNRVTVKYSANIVNKKRTEIKNVTFQTTLKSR